MSEQFGSSLSPAVLRFRPASDNQQSTKPGRWIVFSIDRGVGTSNRDVVEDPTVRHDGRIDSNRDRDSV